VELAITPAGEPDAAWVAAELLPEGSAITWRRWRYNWRPEKPGMYVLKVRATDGMGILQIAGNAPIFPAGSTGYHSVKVQVS
jgi:hypothetical protein